MTKRNFVVADAGLARTMSHADDGLRRMRLIWRILRACACCYIYMFAPQEPPCGANLRGCSIRTERGRGLIKEGQGFAGTHPLRGRGLSDPIP